MRRLSVSFGPHIQDRLSISCMNYETMVALAPAALLGFYFYGFKALFIMVLSMASAVASEAALDRAMKKPFHYCDGSAALTGLLLAMLLPVGVPWWAVIIGAFVAIFLGRQLYGGLGGNPFNTVLVGYLVLTLSWPEAVTTYYEPMGMFGLGGGEFKLFPSEMPVGILAYGSQLNVTDFYSVGAALIGFVPGGIGTSSVLALVAGGVYLCVRGIVAWRIPVGFLVGAFVFALIFWVGPGYFQGGCFAGWHVLILIAVLAAALYFRFRNGWSNGSIGAVVAGLILLGLLIFWLTQVNPKVGSNPFYHVIFGYTIIGAFFLAPDSTTSPSTEMGSLVFGLGAGILAIIIRMFAADLDGVIPAIFFFNVLTPALDRLRVPSYGQVKASR